MRLQRISVLYNSDYDAASGAVDAASVHDAAHAIVAALREAGRTVELVGIAGPDVFEVLRRVREAKPDLVFNLCESMAGDPQNEPTFAGLLDLFAIPYTGANLLALASCLHKVRTKEILDARAIP